MMREKIVEAFNETHGNCYLVTDILDTWLEYEGITGYTRDVIASQPYILTLTSRLTSCT